jgi:hypothetical protein
LRVAQNGSSLNGRLWLITSYLQGVRIGGTPAGLLCAMHKNP